MASTRATIARINGIKKSISNMLKIGLYKKEVSGKLIELLYELDDYSPTMTVDIIQRTEIHKCLKPLLNCSEAYIELKEASHNFLENVMRNLKAELFGSAEALFELSADADDFRLSFDLGQFKSDMQVEIERNRQKEENEEFVIRTDAKYLELIRKSEMNMLFEAKRRMRSKRMDVDKLGCDSKRMRTEVGQPVIVAEEKVISNEVTVKENEQCNYVSDRSEESKASNGSDPSYEEKAKKRGVGRPKSKPKVNESAIVEVVPVKRGRGRPKGRRNKNKAPLKKEESIIILEDENSIIELIDNEKDDETFLKKKTKRTKKAVFEVISLESPHNKQSTFTTAEDQSNKNPSSSSSLSGQPQHSISIPIKITHNPPFITYNTAVGLKDTKLLRSLKLQNISALYNEYQKPRKKTKLQDAQSLDAILN